MSEENSSKSKKSDLSLLIVLVGIAIVAGVLLWKSPQNNNANEVVNNNSNKAEVKDKNEQNNKEQKTSSEEVNSPLKLLGIIDSKYLTEKDFQDYMTSVVDDLIRVKREDVYKESLEVVEKTQEAIKALSKDKPEKATEILEKGLGKLEKVLVISPDAITLPIRVDAQVYSVVADKETLKNTKKLVVAAVNNGDMQQARLLLKDLRSEVEIRTLEIPLEAHGISMRGAIKLIDEKKYDEATKLLSSAMGALVSTEQIIPVPLLNAELLIDKSQEIIDSEPEKAIGMLKEAKEHVEISQLLGYGMSFAPDYAKLYVDLEALEGKIEKKEDSGDAYKDLAKAVEELRLKISK